MLNRSTVKRMCDEGIVKVIFKKEDGSTRVMRCTSNLEYIPKDKWPADSAIADSGEGSIIVYDHDRDAYRSFYAHRVTFITTEALND